MRDDADRQKHEGKTEQEQMDGHLSSDSDMGGKRMHIPIAPQQHYLEKHHASVPYRGSSSQQWQDHFGNDRLHEKQEEGTQKNA